MAFRVGPIFHGRGADDSVFHDEFIHEKSLIQSPHSDPLSLMEITIAACLAKDWFSRKGFPISDDSERSGSHRDVSKRMRLLWYSERPFSREIFFQESIWMTRSEP
jgi:hypothetical protein